MRLHSRVRQQEAGFSADFATRILTLATRDGFTVSFAVTNEQSRKLVRSDARLGDMKARRAN
jgi:hypothetical protein